LEIKLLNSTARGDTFRDMHESAASERDSLKAAIVNLHKVQGRYQTQIAMKMLFDTANLPSNTPSHQ